MAKNCCAVLQLSESLTFYLLQSYSTGSATSAAASAAAATGSDNSTSSAIPTSEQMSLMPPPPPSVSVVISAYIKAYVTVCVWPLVHVTQLSAVWITVLVAFNRYIAICRPFQAHLLCTMRQVRLQAATLGIAILVYNIPRFLEYRIDYKSEPVNNSHDHIKVGNETDCKPSSWT